MIRIGVLTSSRADYGIYLPLLKAITDDNDFELNLIVFGTHLSKFHGYTIDQIEKDGYGVIKRIETLLIGDTPNSIASSYALTALKFSDFWDTYSDSFDIVFALGDRFEMAAAVAASVPFGIKIAHLYGGETTLGAIDNIYRHSISLSSYMHFVSTEIFKERLKKLLNNENPKIQTVGSLSLENIENMKLLSVEDFYLKWKIDLNIQSILITVHPETVDYSLNQQHIEEISCAIETLSLEYQIIITMPNADTAGLLYRNRFIALSERLDNIRVIENFGTQSYFTCMKYSRLMIGNTSSGIVEAASFNKYVLNLGTRQKGRLSGDNVIHLPFDSKLIVLKTKEYAQTTYEGENIYFKKSSSSIIIKTLKNESTLFS